MRKIVALALFVFLSHIILAQNTLTLGNSIDQALENNYAIKIARNDLKIDENNFTRGNAGFLPTLDANFNRTYGLQSFEQNRVSNGNEFAISDNGVSTLRQSYGVDLGWTIFDGLKMFHQYDQLKAQKALGENEMKVEIENLVFDIMSTYYTAAFEKERLNLFEENIKLSNDRLTIAKDKYDLGKASKLEYLQAQVDYNTDRTSKITQLEVLADRKFELMELMASEEDSISFVLNYTLDIDKTLILSDLLEKMEGQNQLLLAQGRLKEIAKYTEDINKADRLPIVGLFANYSHQSFETPAGFAVDGSSDDVVYGLTASWNIFNGRNQQRRIQNASIASSSAQYSYQQNRLALETEIKQIYLKYSNQLNLLELEQENLEVAKESNLIAQERYKIGLSNALELRESQVNLINAELRYQNALFLAKLAEVNLKFLAGMILK